MQLLTVPECSLQYYSSAVLVGVWAAGEKWHYAPMAACLARLGVLACVVSYTLYPDALVPQLVQEVSAAFDWAMEHVEQYGGDRKKV